MKILIILAVGLFSLSSFAGQRVYCDYYGSRNAVGYSLYNAKGKDLGNTVFRNLGTCEKIARNANRARNGIVCGGYKDDKYSVFRIRDGKDLGNATFNYLEDCLFAVRHSAGRMFCAPYVNSTQNGYSPYSVRTGQDLGRKIYTTLQGCVDTIFGR